MNNGIKITTGLIVVGIFAYFIFVKKNAAGLTLIQAINKT